MAKTITIRIKKAGNRLSTFSISDDRGNLLAINVSKEDLIGGMSFSVADEVRVIIVSYTGKDCCNKSINLSITSLTKQEQVDLGFSVVNTASLWSHLTDPTLYNNFYGCIHPYIIEYSFAYQYYDEIVQNIKDYTKVYTYLPGINHIFDDNRRIQTDENYFNKAVLYNDQQSTGLLELAAKPIHNMKAYLSYPKFNTNSKTILFTKSDNFYQFNTFWNVAKDKTIPLFTSTCESMSIDKVINEENMQYTTRSFKKQMIRAKDLKVRLILDNRSDIHLVSQFITAPAQVSYK
jgi:hypothetical protein